MVRHSIQRNTPNTVETRRIFSGIRVWEMGSPYCGLQGSQQKSSYHEAQVVNKYLCYESIGNMRKSYIGALYSFLWFASIFSGFYILTFPTILVLLCSTRKFRKLGDLIFSSWEGFITLCLQFCGVDYIISGDHILYNDSAILLMNHRTRTDWNFFWPAMYQACMPKVMAHSLKMILKDMIRHLPGPGWVMQMSGFIYISRSWEQDRLRLSEALDYMIALKTKSQLLIFPEGTDFNKKSKANSDKYAEKNGLPKYEYTLHPRTTGFSYVTQKLRDSNFLDAVYDITIAYPYEIPLTEWDVVSGTFPREVHVNIKRIPVEELPSSEGDLRIWLEKRWKEKEKTLADFALHKRFPGNTWPKPPMLPTYIAGAFWLFLIVLTVILIITSPMFRLLILVESSIFLLMSFTGIRFNQLEMWYNSLLMGNLKAKVK